MAARIGSVITTMYMHHSRIRNRLPLIALLSIIVLVWFWWPAPFSAPGLSPWRPQPLADAPEQARDISGMPAPAAIVGSGQESLQFDTHVDEGLYTDNRAALSNDLQHALAYVRARFGGSLSERVSVVLKNAADCSFHGIAYTDVRTVQVFTCNDIAHPRAVAILAHEFVHQLAQDRYGPPHLGADLILSEGIATWAAGAYWLGDKPDFRAYVREQRQAGIFYPLATHYNTLGIGGMNALYYEWASFVEYLIGTYGRAKLDQVYVTGHSRPGSADYLGVYGKDLSALESEWQAWLDQ